jgi:hypothetical protein
MGLEKGEIGGTGGVGSHGAPLATEQVASIVASIQITLIVRRF